MIKQKPTVAKESKMCRISQTINILRKVVTKTIRVGNHKRPKSKGMGLSSIQLPNLNLSL